MSLCPRIRDPPCPVHGGSYHHHHSSADWCPFENFRRGCFLEPPRVPMASNGSRRQGSNPLEISSHAPRMSWNREDLVREAHRSWKTEIQNTCTLQYSVCCILYSVICNGTIQNTYGSWVGKVRCRPPLAHSGLSRTPGGLRPGGVGREAAVIPEGERRCFFFFLFCFHTEGQQPPVPNSRLPRSPFQGGFASAKNQPNPPSPAHAATWRVGGRRRYWITTANVNNTYNEYQMTQFSTPFPWLLCLSLVSCLSRLGLGLDDRPRLLPHPYPPRTRTRRGTHVRTRRPSAPTALVLDSPAMTPAPQPTPSSPSPLIISGHYLLERGGTKGPPTHSPPHPVLK